MQLKEKITLVTTFNINPLCLQSVPGNISERKLRGGES